MRLNWRIELDSNAVRYLYYQNSLLDGLDVVDAIEAVGSQSGATSAKVVVKGSGEITE
jgi:hypothetical protein